MTITEQRTDGSTVPTAPGWRTGEREWVSAPAARSPGEWLSRAEEVAAVLATDAADRDRAGRTPYAEVQLLKRSGLVPLFGPAEHGGGELEWPTAYRVIRAVCAGDGSIGQLLAYHYLWSFTVRLLATPEQTARIDAQAAREGWFFGGALNPRDADVVATDLGDEVSFSGRKTFSTGARVSDVTFVEGVLDGDGDHVLAVVPTRQPGLSPHGEWDNMGQRLTESGGMIISDVRVGWPDALGFVDKVFQPRVYSTMNIPTGQLMFGCMYLGVARGALDAAARYVREKGRGWGGHDRSVDEPHIQELFGELTAKLWAAEALADQVALEGLPLHRDPDAVTPQDRGEYAVRAAASKAQSTDVALEITTRIFEATGARSTANRYGFDLFWRNVRTHTLHDPVAYKRREIGTFLLTDEIPVPGWYS